MCYLHFHPHWLQLIRPNSICAKVAEEGGAIVWHRAVSFAVFVLVSSHWDTQHDVGCGDQKVELGSRRLFSLILFHKIIGDSALHLHTADLLHGVLFIIIRRTRIELMKAQLWKVQVGSGEFSPIGLLEYMRQRGTKTTWTPRTRANASMWNFNFKKWSHLGLFLLQYAALEENTEITIHKWWSQDAGETRGVEQ